MTNIWHQTRRRRWRRPVRAIGWLLCAVGAALSRPGVRLLDRTRPTEDEVAQEIAQAMARRDARRRRDEMG